MKKIEYTKFDSQKQKQKQKEIAEKYRKI